MVQLAGNHPERLRDAIAPISDMLVELLDAGIEAGEIETTDVRRTGALIMRTVMYSWFGNRLARSARTRISAEESWQFCLDGLRPRA